MRVPNYSEEDFQRAILALLPTGPIWPRAPGSMLAAVCGVLARLYARNTVHAGQCLVDIFPATTSSTLPDWEASLGLPDYCAGVEPDFEQRRNAVIVKLTDNGGSSVACYIALARSAGFDVTIQEFSAARAGIMRAGDPANGPDWNFSWLVQGPETTISRFRADNNQAGDALASWGNRILECTLSKRKPAHTILRFGYREE